jgi:hypothetical protein
MTTDTIPAEPAEPAATQAPTVAAKKGDIRKPAFYDQVKARPKAPPDAASGEAKPNL